MGRKAETSRGFGRLRRAAETVKRIFTRRSAEETAEPLSAKPARPPRAKKPAPDVHARPTRRETDVPFDVLEREYTPAATSTKTSFRSDGAARQQDQEQEILGDDRWRDEDHYTNKSGDPRIGTRGRTYEANESRDEQR